MKNKKPYLGLVVMVMMLVLSACAVQPTAQPTLEATTTAAPPVSTEAPTATVAEPTATTAPTNTPLPTVTPMPEATAETVVQPTTGFVGSSAQIYLVLDQNTICRTGPATVYHSVASIPAGQRVKAVGRLANNDVYYYIESPDAPGTLCWVFGQGAAVEGDRSRLAMIEPLPSPTPDTHMNFSITYSGITQCSDDYAFKIVVANTDTTVWKSIKLKITDVKTGVAAGISSNRFEEYTNCGVLDNYQENLYFGRHIFITAYNPGHFDYSPYGGTFIIRVTLCTEEDWAGTCMSKEIKVYP